MTDVEKLLPGLPLDHQGQQHPGNINLIIKLIIDSIGAFLPPFFNNFNDTF